MKTVSVVGLGKVGLPLAVQCAQSGFHVIGCDTDDGVVDAVNRGVVPPGILEAGLKRALKKSVKAGLLIADTAVSKVAKNSQVVIIIVPLLIDRKSRPDFRHLDAATAEVGRGLERGSLVIVETTVPVGVTRGRLRPILETESGLASGRDFRLAFSPERVYSGRIFSDLRRYPKVVGGLDRESALAARRFYKKAFASRVLDIGSLEAAEFVKLMETTYRDVNIALANEFAQYATHHSIDIVTAIAAANSQPFSHIHSPGVGVGGHCIPVYPLFLMTAGARPELPALARTINDGMALYAVDRLAAALGGLESRRVLVLGLAYRENVKEAAFSSTLRIITELERQGASVMLHDPFFTPDEIRTYGATPVDIDREVRADAILLQCLHNRYQDLDLSLFPGCGVFLDGRNAVDPTKVHQAGMKYIGIGRQATGAGCPI